MDYDLFFNLAIILLSLASCITSFTLYKLSKRVFDLENQVFNVHLSDPRIDQKFG